MLAAFAGFIIVSLIYRTARPHFIQRAMTQYKEYAFGQLTKKRI